MNYFAQSLWLETGFLLLCLKCLLTSSQKELIMTWFQKHQHCQVSIDRGGLAHVFRNTCSTFQSEQVITL